MLEYWECLFVDEPWLPRVTSQTMAPTAAAAAAANVAASMKLFRALFVLFPK